MAVQLTAAGAPPATPPTWTPIADQTVEAGETLTLTAVASDAVVTEPNLTYSVVGTPPLNSNFNATTRVFTFTPTALQFGEYEITLRVSNGTLSTDETFTITVTIPPDEEPPPAEPLQSLRFDSGVRGNRLFITVGWNSGGDFAAGLVKQGITGIVVEMTDMGRPS